MTTIRIRQREVPTATTNASLSFDGGEEFPVLVTDPFSKEEEDLLGWYFEEYVAFPVKNATAQQAAATVPRYGESLFRQIFADPDAYSQYKDAMQAGIGDLRFEIAGSPQFHGLHWEALKDPKLPNAFVLHTTMVRKNLAPQSFRARVKDSPTINVLLIVARPRGSRDIGYRNIARPLVECLRQANLRVQVDIVRPGTYEALSRQLEQQGSGHYHIAHFDVHGALLTRAELDREVKADRFLYQPRFGRSDIPQYEGQKAFLALEGAKEGQADPVEAGELADLLQLHQIPAVVLNACQSGKQVGATETSLGSRVLQAGAQTVVAMGYSVTVTGARILMERVYRELFATGDLPKAVARGRLELYNRKGRQARFNRTIDLEDWLLPVAYENRPVALGVRDFTPEESKAYYEGQASRYQAHQPQYGFFGRDLDILQFEKRLLAKRNILLVSGMGGAGKTTLLEQAAQWWQQTGLVDEVFYFGWDERAWTREQIVGDIAKRLLPARGFADFQALSPAAQQTQIAGRLRAKRHLLILDNLESITGSPMAILNTLPEAGQAALRSFLAELAGGESLVLLGSRGGEDWLASGTFEDNVYDLPGLDEEAASNLAEAILVRYGATRYRADEDFRKLLQLLDGYPLPIEIVLANLARQEPAEVLQALVAGDQIIDARDRQKKTESIVRCIEYSFGNLSPEAQRLLLCVAPFTGVVCERALKQYVARLGEQKLLAGWALDRFADVIREAANWGLMRPEGTAGYLQLQPILPYFLRGRMQAEAPELQAAIETAFRQYYDGFAQEMCELQQANDPRRKQTGLGLARLEYENLASCLRFDVRDRVSIRNPFFALSTYLQAVQDHARCLELGQLVFRGIQNYSPEQLAGPLGLERAGLLETMATCQLSLKQFDAANESLRNALGILEANQSLDARQRRASSDSLYHSLGRVAQEQRQWAEAERCYRLSLEIRIEFNDRQGQASDYHHLGTLAQQQEQLPEAEKFYQEVLAISIELGDRFHQAGALYQLGMVAQDQKHWEQAGQYYVRALNIYGDYSAGHEQAAAYHQLGTVVQEQGQWAQAEKYYQRALELYFATNDLYTQGTVYYQLGTISMEQRQWAQAEQYCRKSLDIRQGFKDRYSQGANYFVLGRVATEQKQWTPAKDSLFQSLRLYAEFHDYDGMARVLALLARVRSETGDQTIAAAVAETLKMSADQAAELLRQGDTVDDHPHPPA